MKVIINKMSVNLTPLDIENIKPTFTLLHGRRFSGNGFKNISLNNLISAVKNEAFKPEQDKNEIKDFLRIFKAVKDLGYTTPNGQINKENFLTRIITKIKHFFSKTQRDKLFKEFDQVFIRANSKVVLPEKLHVPHENISFEKKRQTADNLKPQKVQNQSLKHLSQQDRP